ncbi:MAG: VWA domain-containing protein [Phycisphaerales bacterium]|nr:VWA domain-containing protein [Phycisphaerales bacterium]
MTLTFDNPAGMLWLVVAAAVTALGIGAALWRRRASARFADAALLPRIAPGLSLARGIWRAALLGGAASCLAMALMDPRAAEQTEELTRRGADVMFVVDVSRSMLAEDATPNRLERARTFISDAIDAMGGDRAGLIDFAGVAALRAPLTLNYDALKSAVDGLETKDSRRGGSMLGDAIRLAAESFPTDDAGHAIVILSDGEDMGSDPVDAAKEAAERGIRIVTVGIGDPREGARIPVSDGPARRYLVHEGEEVWSRMDAATLRDVADATGGLFVPAGTAQVELGEILTRTLGDLERTEGESSVARTTAPLFQWPAALALALLVIESVIAARARRTPATAGGAVASTPSSASASGSRPAPRRRRRARQPQALARALGLAIAACAALTGMGPVARADDAPARPRTVGRGQIDRAAFRDAVTRANAAMQSGQYADAAAAFGEAMDADPTNAAVAYNRGVAEYRAGKLDEAATSFAEAASRGDATLAADAMFNQGNATYQSALRALQRAAPDAGTAGSTPPPSTDAQPDLAAATDAVSQALTHYKDAIAANPSDVDSRVNAELAHTLLKQLREMQQQQQQQNQQEQEQQEQQQDEQPQEDKQQEDTQQQDGGECDNPQQADGEGKSGGESSDKSKSPSGGSSPESDPAAEPQPKDGDQPKEQPQERPQEPSKDGADAAKEDASTDADGKSGQPESSGSESKEPLKDDGAGKPASDQKRPPAPAHARAGEPVPGAPLTKSEAERLLQGVRDRAKQRTDAKERAERVRQVPAVRDW